MVQLFIQAVEFISRVGFFGFLTTNGITSSYYQFSIMNMTSELSKFLQFGLIVPVLAKDRP